MCALRNHGGDSESGVGRSGSCDDAVVDELVVISDADDGVGDVGVVTGDDSNVGDVGSKGTKANLGLGRTGGKLAGGRWGRCGR